MFRSEKNEFLNLNLDKLNFCILDKNFEQDIKKNTSTEHLLTLKEFNDDDSSNIKKSYNDFYDNYFCNKNYYKLDGYNSYDNNSINNYNIINSVEDEINYIFSKKKNNFEEDFEFKRINYSKEDI